MLQHITVKRASAILLLLALIIGSLVTVASIPTAHAASTSTALPDTSSGVAYAMTFNYHVSDPTTESGKTALVWGSQYGSAPSGVVNLYYLPFDRDQGANVSPYGESLAWFQANHPDWIEYECDHTTIPYEYGNANVPLDIANPAVQAWIVQRYIAGYALPHGYSGVAFDNVRVQNTWHRCGHFDTSGQWVQEYSGQTQDAVYAQAMVTWATAMTARVHAALSGSTVAINFRYDSSSSTASAALIAAADLDVDEFGLTDYWTPSGSGPPTGTNWVAYTAATVQDVTAAGKGFLTICEEPVSWSSVTAAQVQWCLANYLLVKNNHSYFDVVGSDGYGYLQYRPEYAAAMAIGEPMSAYAAIPNSSAYGRVFSGGLALVNPSASASATVTLPGSYTYHDLYSHAQGSSVTLAPASGLVLLATPLLSPTPTPTPSLPPSPTPMPPTPTPAPSPTSTPTATPSPTPVPCIELVNGVMTLGTCSGTFTPTP